MRTGTLLIAQLLLVSWLAPAAVHGQTTWHVDDDASTGGDGATWSTPYKYLQDALAVATAGDEIRVAGGTYKPDQDEAGNVIPGERTETFQLITGVGLHGGYAGLGNPGNPDERDIELYETVLSGDLNSDDGPDFANNAENSYHVLTGSGTDATAIVDGFTITAGNADIFPNDRGAGMYSNGGTPTVINCTFSGNSTAHTGGGMLNISSSPTVTNCTFSGNSAVHGGGLYNDGGSATVTNCTFSNNSALNGGGMRNYVSSATVTNCTFSDNSASNFGGGMYNSAGSTTVTDCAFSGNSAGSYGGGMYNGGGSNTPTVTNCAFNGNSATTWGGGMYNYQASPKVIDSMFSGNSASDVGGGMMNVVANTTVANCTFSENSASNWGGGMVNANGSSSKVTDCKFNGNSGGSGGGMGNTDSSPTVINCTFSGNSATVNDGGGMLNYNSSPTVTNSTFSSNSATWGGGVYNDGSNPVLTNCAFSSNSATWGGGVWNQSSSPTLTNCILWDNVPMQIDTQSGTPAVNYSIIQGGWSGAGGTGVFDANPLFVDPDGPDDIPGTDDDDLRLMPGSPAIDAGSNAAVPADTADLDGDGDTTEPTPFDLDGNPRFVDDPNTDDCPQPGADCGTPPIVDMGAYEYQGGGEPIPTVSDWGMAVMTLLLLTAGTLVLARGYAPSHELRS